jgi:hypothetical protein
MSLTFPERIIRGNRIVNKGTPPSSLFKMKGTNIPMLPSPATPSRIIPIPPIHVIKTYGPTLIQPQKRSAQSA